MTKPLGVILAGGKATRMGGGDKGLLPLKDGTLLGHVIARLRPQVDEIALNANGDPQRFSQLSMTVLPDSIDGYPGPLAGVLAGLDWAATKEASHIVTAAADTPFFPETLVADLEVAAQTSGLALASTHDKETGKLYRHPTFGIWPVDLRDDLRTALQEGLRKVVLWTNQHNAGLAEFPVTDADPFFNVNTPEDLAIAEALA